MLAQNSCAAVNRRVSLQIKFSYQSDLFYRLSFSFQIYLAVVPRMITKGQLEFTLIRPPKDWDRRTGKPDNWVVLVLQLLMLLAYREPEKATDYCTSKPRMPQPSKTTNLATKTAVKSNNCVLYKYNDVKPLTFTEGSRLQYNMYSLESLSPSLAV